MPQYLGIAWPDVELIDQEGNLEEKQVGDVVDKKRSNPWKEGEKKRKTEADLSNAVQKQEKLKKLKKV